MPEPIFMELGLYIMTPQSISAAYAMNPPHQSVSLYVLGNGSVKNVTAAMNTHSNRRIVLNVVFMQIASYQGK
jgi:hypothetical protein